MKKKLLFGLLLALLLVPWPVAYAYEGEPGATYPVTVEPAGADLTPHLTVYRNAIGSIEGGDLFYIDATDAAMDLSFILFLTNFDALAASYRNLNLEVGLYAETAPGEWTEVTDYGPASRVLFLSTQTGSVEFTVSGYHRYKVAVNHGCYFAYPEPSETPIAIPEFYLSPT
jgi:hypothetical protein